VIVRIKKRGKTIILTLVFILLLLVWAPWITKDFAINRIVEKLGGPDSRFNYLGQDMAVKDIPKVVRWFPFGRYVYFLSEAGWFISFFGKISP